MNDSKILAEDDVASAAEVADAGFKALMNGDDIVISDVAYKMSLSQRRPSLDAL